MVLIIIIIVTAKKYSTQNIQYEILYRSDLSIFIQVPAGNPYNTDINITQNRIINKDNSTIEISSIMITCNKIILKFYRARNCMIEYPGGTGTVWGATAFTVNMMIDNSNIHNNYCVIN